MPTINYFNHYLILLFSSYLGEPPPKLNQLLPKDSLVLSFLFSLFRLNQDAETTSVSASSSTCY